MIRGTVNDISPGTDDYLMKARFPNGVPAVADENMSDWMKYLYMQFPLSEETTGVPISIDVVDENGNYRNIGTATSDASGTFSFAWKPDIPGRYIVYATFAGSKAYYRSYAQTAFVVDEAPPPEAAPQPEPPTMSEQYFLPVSSGIIVAIIAIIALLVMLLLRKRQ
jgi:hypothetical protein